MAIMKQETGACILVMRTGKKKSPPVDRMDLIDTSCNERRRSVFSV
jgi:hypothetical protein